MADDKSKRGSPDNKRLNKSEPYEVRYAREKAAPAKKAPAKSIVPKPSLRAKKVSGPEKTGPNTAPAERRVPDAVDLLVEDHLAAHACFKKYEKLMDQSGSGAQRKALADAVCQMLTVHTAIEEEIFYPAAKKAGIEEDMLDEADVEHASAKALIAEIQAGQPNDPQFDAKVKVLGEYINHHVVEEHTEMFPKCRRAGMDLAGLRERMEARKAELTAGA